MRVQPLRRRALGQLGRLAAIAIAMAFAGVAHAETKLNVLYAFPSTFKKVKEKIARNFQAEHPGKDL